MKGGQWESQRLIKTKSCHNSESCDECSPYSFVSQDSPCVNSHLSLNGVLCILYNR